MKYLLTLKDNTKILVDSEQIDKAVSNYCRIKKLQEEIDRIDERSIDISFLTNRQLKLDLGESKIEEPENELERRIADA